MGDVDLRPGAGVQCRVPQFPAIAELIDIVSVVQPQGYSRCRVQPQVAPTQPDQILVQRPNMYVECI